MEPSSSLSISVSLEDSSSGGIGGAGSGAAGYFEMDEVQNQLPADIDSFLLDVVDSPDLKFYDAAK